MSIFQKRQLRFRAITSWVTHPLKWERSDANPRLPSPCSPLVSHFSILSFLEMISPAHSLTGDPQGGEMACPAFPSKFLVMEPARKLGSPDSPSRAFFPWPFKVAYFSLPSSQILLRLARDSNIISALSLTKKISSRAVVRRAQCWLWWISCVDKSYKRKHCLWEHFEATGNPQRAQADGAPVASFVLKFPGILQGVWKHVSEPRSVLGHAVSLALDQMPFILESTSGVVRVFNGCWLVMWTEYTDRFPPSSLKEKKEETRGNVYL